MWGGGGGGGSRSGWGALMDAARCAEVAALVKSGTRRGGWSAGPEY